MRIGTPSNIDVLLHYYCSPEPHPRLDAPVVKTGIHELVKIGALENKDGTYNTTALGAAWVRCLCNVHIPQVVFIDEHGQQIKRQ